MYLISDHPLNAAGSHGPPLRPGNRRHRRRQPPEVREAFSFRLPSFDLSPLQKRRLLGNNSSALVYFGQVSPFRGHGEHVRENGARVRAGGAAICMLEDGMLTIFRPLSCVCRRAFPYFHYMYIFNYA